MKKSIIFLPLLFVLLIPGVTLKAAEYSAQITTLASEEEGLVIDDNALYFFYSPTCPHCHKEHAFLDDIEPQYPSLTIHRYKASDSRNIDILRTLAKKHDAERYLGSVPLTFIGDEFIIGYESDSTTGKEIEEAIQVTLAGSETNGEVTEPISVPEEKETTFTVPFLGTVSENEYSLPVLAILLGFLDGFNVCSLGALVLIIGLSLKLQRRKAIIFLGGTFIFTTAIVYGALIVAWYHVFELFNTYIDFMKVLVSLLAIGGGAYFLKEFLRMSKQGAVCELQESKLVTTMMQKTTEAFEHKTKIIGIVGAVLAFAGVITIVEFPCSAAVPVVFAGILADAGVSTVSYLSYISLFVLFYMLDEIIIFGIAAYKLKLWMTSGTFTKYAVLAEALILIAIGLLYLVPTLGQYSFL